VACGFLCNHTLLWVSTLIFVCYLHNHLYWVYTNRNVLLAGSDYESVQAAVLTYSSASTRSQSFTVTILTDSLTELTEFFEVIISIRLFDSGGDEINLVPQLSGRVEIDRAQVFINDINSKETTSAQGSMPTATGGCKTVPHNHQRCISVYVHSCNGLSTFLTMSLEPSMRLSPHFACSHYQVRGQKLRFASCSELAVLGRVTYG
jgi:hypothetical protein